MMQSAHKRLAWALGLVILAAACRSLDPREAAADDEPADDDSAASASSSGGGSSGTASSSGGSTSSASSSSSSSSGQPPPPFDGGPILPAGDHAIGPDDRPGTLTVPNGYDGAPLPLVLLLHGTGESATTVEQFLEFKPAAEAKGFFLLRANAKQNQASYSAWNATDSCCMYQTEPDDSSYLAGLIAAAQGLAAVDPKRIYVVGHSSGGFMAYRMACDHADLVAGIVSLAGENYDDASLCQPSAPVSVLQIQGDSDSTVNYDGGTFFWFTGSFSYPGAEESVADWAGYDGCAPSTTAGPDIDLLDGDETTSLTHGGCQPGGAAELWTMHGVGHEPDNFKAFSTTVAEWLLARPKP